VALAHLLPEQYRSAGLSAAELDATQEDAGVRFPSDLCELLSETVPTGPQFPDWRTRPREALAAFRDSLIDGIAFDAINNAMWLDSWGEKPIDSRELRELIRREVDSAPTLIPVYGHRAIPNEPLEAGNPVYSIVQTDIVVYGSNLREYLINEFHPRPPGGAVVHSAEVRTIRFWDSLVRA
jgi:hypothetical protein